jgi:hypothetical protein
LTGAFSPVLFDVTVDGRPHQELHVDGGAFAQVFLYPASVGELRRQAIARRQRVVPARAYVIRNGRLEPVGGQVERRTVGIAGRAVAAMISASGFSDVQRIYTATQCDHVEFRVAHIAALLMTFFYKELPELVREGRVHLAQPPLYRLQAGGKSVYAKDDADKDRLMKRDFKANQKVEVSRFKGLGEMPPAALKETTMDPRKRTLLKVVLPTEERARTSELIEALMGRRPELRFRFIQDNAAKLDEEAVDA